MAEGKVARQKAEARQYELDRDTIMINSSVVHWPHCCKTSNPATANHKTARRATSAAF